MVAELPSTFSFAIRVYHPALEEIDFANRDKLWICGPYLIRPVNGKIRALEVLRHSRMAGATQIRRWYGAVEASSQLETEQVVYNLVVHLPDPAIDTTDPKKTST